MCAECARAILDATNEAIRLTAKINSADELEAARTALRILQRLAPDDVTRDLILYARACIVRGDRRGAYESIERWREEMRAIGVLPAA